MIARLEFDPGSNRWEIGDRELHCGDCFHIYDGNGEHPMPVRIEHASDGWYLITPYGLCRVSNRLAEVGR